MALANRKGSQKENMAAEDDDGVTKADNHRYVEVMLITFDTIITVDIGWICAPYYVRGPGMCIMQS